MQVLNKHVPADFDPALVPRGSKLSKKDGTVPVRMMLPFSIQCDTCNTFLYRGRKFNSKKEAVQGPEGRYLGIQRWRFYIKCTHCSRTVTFLTDPKNADYEMESGGSRNYEVYKDKAQTEELSAAEKEELEKEDKMKALENRILDSQMEMQELDNLESIKAMNRKHVQLLSGNSKGGGVPGEFGADAKAILDVREEAMKKKQQQQQKESESLNEHGITEEEEALVKSIKFGKKSGDAINTVKRLDEEDEKRVEEKRKQDIAQLEARQKDAMAKASSAGATQRVVPIVKVKRRRPVAAAGKMDSNDNATKKAKPAPTVSTAKDSPGASGGGLAGLLGGYGSDSDSD